MKKPTTICQRRHIAKETRWRNSPFQATVYDNKKNPIPTVIQKPSLIPDQTINTITTLKNSESNSNEMQYEQATTSIRRHQQITKPVKSKQQHQPTVSLNDSISSKRQHEIL